MKTNPLKSFAALCAGARAATLIAVALMLGALPAAATDYTLSELFSDVNFINYLKNNAYSQNKDAIDAAIENGSYVPTKTGNPFFKDVWNESDFEQIKIMNLNTNSSISDLGPANTYLVNLERVTVPNLQVTSLDLSGLTNLNYISATDNNKLTTINLEGCTSAKELYIYNNSKLTTINLTGCTGLEQANLRQNALTSIDVSTCTGLKKIEIYKNQLTSMDVSGLPVLYWVDANCNHLTSFRAQNCPLLRWIEIHHNQIKSEEMTLLCQDLTKFVKGGTPSEGILRAYDNYNAETNYPEGNELVTKWVQVLKNKKRWYPKYYKNNTNKWTDWYGNADYSRLVYIGENDNPTLDANTEFIESALLRKYIREVAYTDNQTLIDNARNNGDYVPYNSEKRDSGNPFWDMDKIAKEDIYWIRNLRLQKWTEGQMVIKDDGYGGQYTEWRAPVYFTTLEGINHLYMLEHLDVSGHKLTGLDVSGMENLRILRCENQVGEDTDPAAVGMLANLHVENCTSLHQIFCDNNSLNSIDVSSCHNLKHLRCNNNPLGTLDVTGNANLYWLDCYNCDLAELNVRDNAALERLYCYETRDGEADGTPRRGRITTLDLSKNPKLWELRISNLPLQSLDLSHNTELQILYANNMDLSDKLQDNLDILPNLRQLSCFAANLSSLDVSKNPKLTRLICYDNQIKSLDLSNNPELDSLICGDNQDGVDRRNVPYPSGGNLLTSLDLSKNTKLTTLRCAKNHLMALDLTGLTLLRELNYAEQTRAIKANCAAWMRDDQEYKLYYMRADDNESIADEISIFDESVRTANEEDNETSIFDLNLVDMDSWTGGAVFHGDADEPGEDWGAPRHAPIIAGEDDLKAKYVVGDILVLSDVTIANDGSATGTATYCYDVHLDPSAEATDAQTPFTLYWSSDANVVTDIEKLHMNSEEPVQVTYCNVAGMVSDRPFEGMNIVIKRYADGTVKTTKLAR